MATTSEVEQAYVDLSRAEAEGMAVFMMIETGFLIVTVVTGRETRLSDVMMPEVIGVVLTMIDHVVVIEVYHEDRRPLLLVVAAAVPEAMTIP